MTNPKLFFKSFSRLVLFAVFLVIGSQHCLFAQEDLTLPGDEKPVIVNTNNSGGDTTDESADGVTLQGKRSLLQKILDSGIFMIPLVLLLFGVLALSVYLLLDLKAGTFSPKGLYDSMIEAADAGDLGRVAEHARESASCLGQVMGGACEYIYDRGYKVLDGDSILDLMADASQEFNRKRVNLLNYLSVIAQAAPMVGLLGTVSGMIKAFDTLDQKGMGDSGQLAGNISEALYTTAGGLIVALPAIFLFFFFRNKMVGHIAAVDKQCFRVLNTLRRQVVGTGGSSGGSAPGPSSPPSQTPPPPPQAPPSPPPENQHPLA